MKKELVIALDSKGHKVVVINEILFHGRRNQPWDKVEQYLKRYIGRVVTVAETGEEIYIGPDFPDEYKGSQDSLSIHGHNAKAKANAVQGIEEMISIARKTNETENLKDKNSKKAKYGWYRYLTRFALPVVNEQNTITHYNIYLATLIVRKDYRRKLHLYDVIHVKKKVISILYFRKNKKRAPRLVTSTYGINQLLMIKV